MEEIEVEGRVVGKVIGDTYITNRKKNHFMRKFAGFGISERVISLLETKGVKTVQIRYFGEREINLLECELEKFRKSPLVHQYSGRLAKDDKQKFVPQAFMKLIHQKRKVTT